MLNKKITLSFITILGLSSLHAYEMKPMGFKATGMGGTGVASSRGSMATYYNPALLGMSDYTSEISLNAGIGIRENKLVDAADQINKLELSDSLSVLEDVNLTSIGTSIALNSDNLTADQLKAVDNIEKSINIIKLIPAANGLQLLPSFSLSGQFSRYFAIGAYANIDLRAKMVIDKNRLGIIVKKDDGNLVKYDPDTNQISLTALDSSYESASLQYAMDNNKTYLNVSSIVSAEVPLSFAYPLETKNGLFSFGITLKPMSVETFSKDFYIGTDSGDIGDEYNQNKKTYSAFGVDLGVAYKEEKTGLILGLIGKNINAPSFKTEAVNGRVEEFTMDRYFRAGLSLPVWNDNIEFAVDADLQQSDTSYEGMKSQYVGGGMEFHPASWFALRVGAMKNVAIESIDEGFIYTAGLGFGLKWLQFDLSAQASQKTGTYDGNEIPKYANVNFSLISRWGDGYNRKVAPVVKEEIVPLEAPATQEEPIKTLSPEDQERIKKDSEKAFKELDQAI